jgi:O-antigen/teichoic acid export membrane protein
MRLSHELRRLGRHSAVYGLGGLVSRILATLLLPLYTHYLPPGSFGRVEIVTAATAVLAILFQMGSRVPSSASTSTPRATASS